MKKGLDIITYVILFLIIIVVSRILFFSSISVKRIELNKKEIVVSVGLKNMIKATVMPDDADDPTIEWLSEDESIATVDKNGVVSGIKEGETNITVRTLDKTISAKCHVTVEAIKVEKVLISHTDLQLDIGENKTISAIVEPSNATYQSITYQSSNPKIVTVDNNGNVVGIKTGKAEITAIDKGGKLARCSVTVGVELQKIEINKDSIELNVGKTKTLKATLTPKNATEITIKWSSSNTKVATVDDNGLVQAKSVGEAIISVKTNTGKTAFCKVVVKQPVTGVSLNKKSVSLYTGKSVTLVATVKPSDAENKNVKWSSNKESVAIVDTKGKIHALKEGTAVITVKTEDGNKTATCKVTVKSQTTSTTTTTPQTVLNPIVPSNPMITYESSTLKYYVQNNARYYLTYIWMQDPANQIRKLDPNTAQYGKVLTDAEMDSQGLARYKGTIGNTMNAYIAKGIIPASKGAVGFNGGGFYIAGMWDPPTRYYDRRSSSWINVHNGVLTRNRINEEDAPIDTIIGITGSGNLKCYGSSETGGASKRQSIYNAIMADKVQNTWAFNPLLVGDGVDSSWWDNTYAQRNAICQINSNNYVMYSSANGSTTYWEMQSLFKSIGCKVAMNLDGGGSTSMFYKKAGDTAVTKLKCGSNPCREVIEGIYFTEK